MEPNLVVVPIAAGDPDLSKEDLGSAIEEFTAGVALDLAATGGTDAIHANYWLSAVAGQTLAHALRVPLAVSFHTLARVKLAHGDPEPGGRAAAEERAVASADVLCAASASDASDLSTHYGADPRRIVRVPPGVQHAFFSPGSRAGARRALGLGDAPHVLFVGRIQPLKGLDVAVCAMAELQRSDARLLAVLVLEPKRLSGAELEGMVGAATFGWLADWLNSYVVKEHPEKETLRQKWMALHAASAPSARISTPSTSR